MTRETIVLYLPYSITLNNHHKVHHYNHIATFRAHLDPCNSGTPHLNLQHLELHTPHHLDPPSPTTLFNPRPTPNSTPCPTNPPPPPRPCPRPPFPGFGPSTDATRPTGDSWHGTILPKIHFFGSFNAFSTPALILNIINP
ncbi:hypothetical protein RND81_01G092500 [Saponaria officinalis]|uniref:Uncharacterized protein n=1 Tax=Saponaria officinalis TaxID=3572 RepID=A0AAW1N6Q7_SAPOF